MPRFPTLSCLLACLFGATALAADTCVWKVSGPTNVAYVAGSVHMLRESDLPFPKAFAIAYEDSDLIYFEAFVDVARSPRAQNQIARLGTLSKHEHLREFVTQHTYLGVEHYLRIRSSQDAQPAFANLLSPRHHFAQMSPGRLAMTIATLEAEAHGVSPMYGVEYHIAEKAQADAKPILGLESPFYQARLLNTLNRREADRLLRLSLKNAHHAAWYYETLIGSWKAGDLPALEQLVSHDYPVEDSLAQKLIYNRNQKWLPDIASFLQGSDGLRALFVVGAAHIVGEGNLLSLLQEQGFAVEPVGV